MSGILIVRPPMQLSPKELVNCQTSIIKMIEDGVVVVQPGYEVEYIRTDEDEDTTTKVGFV